MNYNFRKIIFYFIFISFLLFCTVILLELGGRYLPILNLPQGKSTVQFIFDPEIGRLHQPGSTGSWSSACYHIDDIHFNKFGMRDREREVLKTKPRIAILGDSMIEGLQVKDDDVVNRVMECLRQHSVEVLNFGISGFGTVQELIAFKTKVAQFKPDVVILAFFPKNDVRDNSMVLRSRAVQSWGVEPPDNVPFFGLDAAGNLREIYRPQAARFPDKLLPQSLARKIYQSSKALQVIDLFYTKVVAVQWRSLRWRLGPVARLESLENTRHWELGVYLPPRGDWLEAWKITEKTLLTLNQEIKSHGSELVVIALPSEFELELDPEKEFFLESGIKPPRDFDPTYPHKRMQQFCEKHHIQFQSLYGSFKEYRDQHNLTKRPFLGYSCDGHYRPVGHQLMAQKLLDFLLSKGLIPRPQVVQQGSDHR